MKLLPPEKRKAHDVQEIYEPRRITITAAAALQATNSEPPRAMSKMPHQDKPADLTLDVESSSAVETRVGAGVVTTTSDDTVTAVTTTPRSVMTSDKNLLELNSVLISAERASAENTSVVASDTSTVKLTLQS